jgi:TnpA family transposase
MPAEILTLPIDRVTVTKVSRPMPTSAPHISMYAIDALAVDGTIRQYETTNPWKASQCELSRLRQTLLRIHYKRHPRFGSNDIVRVEVDS